MSPPAKLYAATGVLLAAAKWAWDEEHWLTWVLSLAALICFFLAIFYDPIRRVRSRAVYKAEAIRRGLHIYEQLGAVLGSPDPVELFRWHMAEYVLEYFHDVSALGYMDRRIGKSYNVRSVNDVLDVRAGVALVLRRLSPDPYDSLAGWWQAKRGGFR
jgi:hypothetical protein